MHSAAVASSGLNVQLARRVFRFQAERRLYRLRTNMGLVLVLKYLLRAVAYLKTRPTYYTGATTHTCLQSCLTRHDKTVLSRRQCELDKA